MYFALLYYTIYYTIIQYTVFIYIIKQYLFSVLYRHHLLERGDHPGAERDPPPRSLWID